MARAGLKWTLKDLAGQAGVNPNTISRFEQGRDVMAGKLGKIETALAAAGVRFIADANGLGVVIGPTDRTQAPGLRPQTGAQKKEHP